MFVSVRSAMISHFCVRTTSKRWFFGGVHETRFIRCHVGTHVDFRFVLHSRTLLVLEHIVGMYRNISYSIVNPT